MNNQEFLERVKSDCLQHGVEFICVPGNRVYYEGRAANGYFHDVCPVEYTRDHIIGTVTDEIIKSGATRPILAVAQGGKTELEFMSLVAHEFGHMQQYLESIPLWESTTVPYFDAWIDGEDMEEDLYKPSWQNVVRLEADCESRVLGFIKKYDLSIDAELYAKRANAYLIFYQWCLKTRLWYNKAPYEIKEIVDAMDSTLHDIEYYAQPDSFQNIAIFDRCADA